MVPTVKFCGPNLFRKASLSRLKKGNLLALCYRNKKLRFVPEEPLTCNLKVLLCEDKYRYEYFQDSSKKCQVGFVRHRTVQLLHPTNDS